MGACDFGQVVEGAETAREAFRKGVADAQHWHGHGGYTGTLAEKDSFCMIRVPEGEDPFEYADMLIEEDDPRVCDKWGDAGCIDLGDGNSIHAASNFFSTQESNMSPRQQLNLVSSEDTASTAGLQQSRRHIWRPIAFVALAFLISEWLVYHRATLSKVYSMIFRREKQ